MELDSLFTAAELGMDSSNLNQGSSLESPDFILGPSLDSPDFIQGSSMDIPDLTQGPSIDSPSLSQGSVPSTESGSKLTGTDANNNEAPAADISDGASTNDDNIDVSTIKAQYKVEYNLRRSSLVNRVETEKRRKLPKEPKPKSRPPPLSKYRRRAANARERGRMLEINDAFDALSDAIPVYENENGENKGKPTKITTLRLALNYIAALRETLGYPSAASESGFSSAGEGCNSPSGSSTSDSASECLQSPATSNLDSEGETMVQ